MREYKKEQAILIGALVGLCRSLDNSNYTKDVYDILVESILVIRSEDENVIKEQTKKVHDIKYEIVPDCSVCSAPCGKTSDYCLEDLDSLDENLKQLKVSILDSLIDYAEYLQMKNITMDNYLQPMMSLMKGLFSIGYDYFKVNELEQILLGINENKMDSSK